MALSFRYGDLDEVVALGRAHPDPLRFWTWVEARTTNTDLLEVVAEMKSAWAAAGTNELTQRVRTADAIQELGAVESTLQLVRREETGSGGILETQVHHTAVKL